ncbi:MAG: hypothetical protein ACRCSP_01555 [Rhodoglobus sp.]
MTSPTVMISLLAELLTIMGLACGGLCFGILLCLRLARGPWYTAPAAIAEGQLSWLSADGEVHQRALTEAELALPHDHDSLEVFYRRGSSVCYFEKTSGGETLLRLLGIIFCGIGVFAVIVSTVLLFVS